MDKVIHEMKEKYAELLKTLCMTETPSESKTDIDKMVDLIERFALENGLETERFPFENAGDFLLIKTGDFTNEKPVLLMAHMDTVHKKGAFGEKIVTRDGDWMYGPGVMDCKGGIVTGLCIMELLKNKKPIYFLLTSDEEIGGRLSGEKGRDIIINTAKKSKAVFNLEPGKPNELAVSRKGILKMSVEISGIAAHAGNFYFDGASAIKEAAHTVIEIEGMSKKDGVTYNCGTINGGTVINTVPDKCTIGVDIRVSTFEEMQNAEKIMYDLEKKCVIPNTKRAVSVLSKRPPMELTDKTLGLLDIWNSCAKNLGIKEYKGVKKGGGTDAAYTVLAGVPTLCSCGMVGYDEHTVNEKVDLSTFEERVLLICSTINVL